MIATINVRCNAAKPNFPLQPMFAFMGSPSSIRVLDVPKSIGSWEITSVRVAVLYPNNLTIEKVAVRTGSVWVATIEGCEVAGKVGNGYQILADGKDEDGNDVTGYVLGKGDVFILDNDSDVKKLLEKYTVRYLDEVPAAPSVGDLLNINGQVRLFDGERWLYISNGGEPTVVYDSEIKIKENGTEVGSFTTNSETPVDIDIPVPSRTSDLVNDVGFITESAIPSNVGAFQNDVGYLTSVSWGEVQDKPDVALMSDIPSNVSELENDAGYITASEVVIPSNLSDFNNDVGFITASSSEFTDKRDYTDLTYNKYDMSDSVYKGIRSWRIENLKIGDQTYTITTNTRGTENPNYETFWNSGPVVVYTSDLSTFYFANGGAALTSFTLNTS